MFIYAQIEEKNPKWTHKKQKIKKSGSDTQNVC